MERWGKHRLRGKKRGPNPTDRAKQGVKRSLLTEEGIPIGIAIDGANRTDFRMAKETITSIPIKRPKPTKKKRQGMCMDKGYDFDEVRMLLQRFHFVPHIRSGGEEAQRMKKNPRWRARRWVVERTHSWMNRLRDILICWTKKPENFLAQLHLACAYITLGRCGLLG
jgi:putative transposase